MCELLTREVFQGRHRHAYQFSSLTVFAKLNNPTTIYSTRFSSSTFITISLIKFRFLSYTLPSVLFSRTAFFFCPYSPLLTDITRIIEFPRNAHVTRTYTQKSLCLRFYFGQEMGFKWILIEKKIKLIIMHVEDFL